MTLPIDFRRRGIGRIHVRSGTRKRAVRDAMKQMLGTLHQIGRADILRDIRDGKVTVLEVYERFRAGRLEQLPAGELMRPLAAAWERWLADKELAPRTAADYRAAGDRLLEIAGSNARLTDLPALLTEHRRACRGTRASTFNRDRRAALSLLGSLFDTRHPLYLDAWRVEPLRIPKARQQPFNPQTVAELHALAARLAPHHAATLWGYALTGMRPEEMFEEGAGEWQNRWTLEADRVRIDGTKTPASRRVVPRVGLIVKPRGIRRSFAKALNKASTRAGGRIVTPYDLRRSYAQILDLARIPQFRQDYYMAHGPRDLNALYKRAKECAEHLAEDAAAIEAVVGSPNMLRAVR